MVLSCHVISGPVYLSLREGNGRIRMDRVAMKGLAIYNFNLLTSNILYPYRPALDSWNSFHLSTAIFTRIHHF